MKNSTPRTRAPFHEKKAVSSLYLLPPMLEVHSVAVCVLVLTCAIASSSSACETSLGVLLRDGYFFIEMSLGRLGLLGFLASVLPF